MRLYQAAVEGEVGLGKRARKIILDTRNELLMSTASLAELAYLNFRGRIKLGHAELKRAVGDLQIAIIPLRESHAERCFHLPPQPKDPLDRMIIATALAEDIPILSNDSAFLLCKELQLIWN